jgi:hypothetical protein
MYLQDPQESFSIQPKLVTNTNKKKEIGRKTGSSWGNVVPAEREGKPTMEQINRGLRYYQFELEVIVPGINGRSEKVAHFQIFQERRCVNYHKRELSSPLCQIQRKKIPSTDSFVQER